MKIQEFVKNEPGRAVYLILVLSVSFLTCFFALAAFGGVTIYAYTHFRAANTALFAADILSLEAALEEGNGSDIQMYSALLCERTPQFLPSKTAEALNDLILSPDQRFSQLCKEIREMTEAGSLSGTRVKDAVESLPPPEEGLVSDGRGDETGQPALQYRSNPVETAEKFFGIHGVFHPFGAGACCKNIFAEFGGRNDALTVYSAACTPGVAQISEQEGMECASEFAAQQLMRTVSVLSAEERGGIWWISVSDGRGAFAKVGVRGDTGRVCFYLRMPDGVGEKE